MDKQIDTTHELCLNDDILRDLVDTEVLMIGGGEIVGNTY
jgi:hypothetical protein